MTLEKITNTIGLVSSEEVILSDLFSANDLISFASFENGIEKVVIKKENIAEDFFKLSTKIAGDILQKFVTYHLQVAIVGDFSGYTSKPLHDFIYECNKGAHIFFVSSIDEGVSKLENV